MTSGNAQPTPLTVGQVRAFILDAKNVPVLNISQVGIALETKSPLLIGQRYAFWIQSADDHVLVDGEVVRCELRELAEEAHGAMMPIYYNGIEFHMDRNPKELGLMRIIRANLFGEKRLGALRITPIVKTRVHVGRDCFHRVRAFERSGLVVECSDLLDMDAEWELLFQVAEQCFTVECRIVYVSKKEGVDYFITRLDFLNLADAYKPLLERVLAEVDFGNREP